MAVFPELPPQLRTFFPLFYWNWWQAFRTWLLELDGKTSMATLPIYANNAAAIAGGLVAGDFYRTGANPDPVCQVH